MAAMSIGLMTRSLVALMTAAPRRETPDARTAALLGETLPEDLRAVLEAWTHHARPYGALRAWSLFEVWDFMFAIEPLTEAKVRDMCATLAGSLARSDIPSGVLVQLGFDGGGHTVFAGIKNGATVTFGPERGEDYGDLDGFLMRLQERADFADEPALALEE